MYFKVLGLLSIVLFVQSGDQFHLYMNYNNYFSFSYYEQFVEKFALKKGK